MLHHRRKLDRQGAREFADGHALFLLETCQDSPARRIDERCESPVALRAVKLRPAGKYGVGWRFRQAESLATGARSHRPVNRRADLAPARAGSAVGAGSAPAGDPLSARKPGRTDPYRHQELGRIDGIGHRITGDRTGQSNKRGTGWEYVHVAIDDASRLAY